MNSRYAYARSPALAEMIEERATIDAVIKVLGLRKAAFETVIERHVLAHG